MIRWLSLHKGHTKSGAVITMLDLARKPRMGKQDMSGLGAGQASGFSKDDQEKTELLCWSPKASLPHSPAIGSTKGKLIS